MNMVISFPFVGSKGPNLFHHDNAPVYKGSSIKTWFARDGVEELDPQVKGELTGGNWQVNKLRRKWWGWEGRHIVSVCI